MAAPLTASSDRGASCYLFSCPATIPSTGLGIHPWGLGREPPDYSAFLHSEEGSSFPGCGPTDCTVESEYVVGIKPGYSGVVIQCQDNEFTCIWLAESFFA